MKKYKTYIIGAGSIGATKDDKYDYIGGVNILTHAHACYNHSKIELAGIIDIDFEKAKKAAIKWETLAYNCLAGMNGDAEIIIIATPTETHYEVMLEVLKFNPKLVIIEKPFCNNKAECGKIIFKYKAAGVPILVDYIRRFDIKHQEVKANININNFGEIYQCRFIYTRGFKRDGSHAIDVCNWWFGQNLYSKILNINNPIVDYSSKDKTYTAYMIYEKCPHVFLTCVNGRMYDIFEIDILTEKGRIRFIAHGLEKEFYLCVPEPMYGDYFTLTHSAEIENTQLNTALMEVLNNAINSLETGANGVLRCTGRDALKVHDIYNGLLS